MGTLLQVRVSVFTVDVDQVEARWPVLVALAYPPGYDYAPAKRGVLELVDTLRARVDAGGASEAVAARLRPGLTKAVGHVAQLNEALAVWKADEARTLTEKIEDMLDELEGVASYK